MSPTDSRAGHDPVRARISETLTGPLAALGLDVEAVELSSAGRRRLLRVAVDQDGGVRDQDLVAASRVASDALDATDVMGDAPYTLEVTSPGVDRPLTLPRHWRRNQGRLVRISLAGGETLTGRVGPAGETSATIEVGGSPRVVDYDDVEKAIVQIEFNRREEVS